MKKVYSFCLALILAVSTTFTVSAQATEKRTMQAGMTGNFGINMVNVLDNHMEKESFNHDLSIGMAIHTSFKSAPNLGLATGFEFDFTKLNYAFSSDSVFYRYDDTQIFNKGQVGGTEFLLRDRKMSNVSVSIPLMMLFRTEAVGDWKFFGKFGLRNSFLISQKITDNGFDVTQVGAVQVNTAKENTNMKSFGENFFYRGSVGFSAGAEWNFIGSTSLVPELGFYYGLTPLHFRAIGDNFTLYEADGTYFYPRAKQNQLILKVSILF
jgi:hypothetical protein